MNTTTRAQRINKRQDAIKEKSSVAANASGDRPPKRYKNSETGEITYGRNVSRDQQISDGIDQTIDRLSKGESAHPATPELRMASTPGPWHVPNDQPCLIASNPNAKTPFEMRAIATVRHHGKTSNFPNHNTFATEEDLANARLIAAAPTMAAERDKLREQRNELLKALKLVQAFLNDLSKTNPGYLGKLGLQDYGQFNEAMIAMPRAIQHAEEQP